MTFSKERIKKENLFLANRQPRSSSLPKHLWNVGPSDERHRQEVERSEGTVHARLQGRCKKGRQEKVDSLESKEVRQKINRHKEKQQKGC